MSKVGKLTLAISGAAIAGAVGYATLESGWNALVNAAADQAKARRLVVDQQTAGPQLPKLFTIGGGGGE